MVADGLRGWLVAVLLLVPGAAGAVPAGWLEKDSFGEHGRGRNELEEPVDVVLNDDEDLAVLDRRAESIVFFARRGRWLGSIGGRRGSAEVVLDHPEALAVDRDGVLWVVDTGNHRLVLFNRDGTLVRTHGSLGTAGGRFRSPSDLTMDRQGRVYVADTDNRRIQVLSRNGIFLDAWEQQTGGRREHLEHPVGVAFSDQGKGGVWVLNRGWTRLERFDLDGEWVESLEVAGLVEGDLRLVSLEVEPVYYRMFLADAAGRRVLALNRRGELLAEIAGPAGASWDPRGLAVSRSFDLFVCDAGKGRVVQYEAH